MYFLLINWGVAFELSNQQIKNRKKTQKATIPWRLLVQFDKMNLLINPMIHLGQASDLVARLSLT